MVVYLISFKILSLHKLKKTEMLETCFKTGGLTKILHFEKHFCQYRRLVYLGSRRLKCADKYPNYLKYNEYIGLSKRKALIYIYSESA